MAPETTGGRDMRDGRYYIYIGANNVLMAGILGGLMLSGWGMAAAFTGFFGFAGLALLVIALLYTFHDNAVIVYRLH